MKKKEKKRPLFLLFLFSLLINELLLGLKKKSERVSAVIDISFDFECFKDEEKRGISLENEFFQLRSLCGSDLIALEEHLEKEQELGSRESGNRSRRSVGGSSRRRRCGRG
jgi:hypothetical protein